jgi:hypothetical protein
MYRKKMYAVSPHCAKNDDCWHSTLLGTGCNKYHSSVSLVSKFPFYYPSFITLNKLIFTFILVIDSLCGLVVRVPGYRSNGLGSIPGLPDFLRSSRSGTESTLPRKYN